MTSAQQDIADTIPRLKHSIRGIANWVLDFADEIGYPVTNMALNKLIFFAFEKVLKEDRIILTDAKIEAWDHGPVFREVYQGFKSYGDGHITGRVRFYSLDTGEQVVATANLDPAISDRLKAILKPLIPLSASKLRNLSHVEGGAWHQVWCHDGYANPGMEITPELILNT